MFLICSILNGLIGFYLSSIFKNFSILFIAFFGFIVLNIEVLSLFKMINGENILILTLVEFLIVHLYWLKKKKPVYLPNFKGFLVDLKKVFVEDKSLIVLSLFWLFMVGVSLVLACLSPVNEPDAQGYHALRSLFWLKDGFISHFEVSDIRCHSMPINSELFYVWILALFKKDTLFGLLQFCSYFLLLFSSFNIMEFYNIEFKKRIWALIIFSSFAGVISQISSTQTDLCVGALLSCSIYLIHCYIKDKRLSLLFFSSLCMGLSFGVKSTGVIGSIPLIIWYIVLLRKDFIKYFIFLCFNFIVFSSYNYILNFINYGNFLGSNSALLGHGFWGGIKGGIANFIRYIFQLFDFSGFTIGFYLNEYLLNMQNGLIELFGIQRNTGENVGLTFTNISMTEQVLGFGILGFLVFLPSSIMGFFNKKLRIFSFIFWGLILTISFSIAYMIYSIRFLVTFVAITIPLLSLTYTNRKSLYKFFVILFAIFYMGYASLFLSQRPMMYLVEEYKKDKNIESIQENMRDLNYKFYSSFNEAYTMKKAVEPYCKDNNKIGIFNSNGYMVYSAKYLEMNNNCKIDTLNALHIREYDLKKYNVLLTQKFIPQKTEVINKKDILYPMTPNFMAICYFEGLNDKREDIILDYSQVKMAHGAHCYINHLYLEELNFKKTKDIEAVIPEYLKERTNETIKDFILWERN